MSVNMPRCLPIDTSAACLSCILMLSEPLAFCETSAIASSVALSSSSVGTICTRGSSTIVGRASSSSCLIISLRQVTALPMQLKPSFGELAQNLLNRDLGALGPAAQDFRN